MNKKYGYKNKDYENKVLSIPQNFSSSLKNGKLELIMYGDIGSSWYDDGVTAKDVSDALNDNQGKDVIVRLNSPGGSAFDGLSIYNRLVQHDGKVTVYVDGYACSSASIIAMAGDEIIMGEGAMLMIHEASVFAYGTKEEFRKQAQVLEDLEEGIIDIYFTKAKISREEIKEMVDAETWFNSSTALEKGFATSIASQSVDEKENNEDIKNLKNNILQMKNEIETLTNELKNVKNKEEEKQTTKKRRIF